MSSTNPTGATAVVHEGTWNSISVAIKVFKEFPGGAYDPDSAFGRDLFQELTMLHNVGNHPNIVSFFGAVTRSEPRIVLELVTGPTLEGYLHGEIIPGQQANVLRNKLPIETIAGWTRDLLSGINFMHDRDPCIIHRDLKPANLVLVPDLSQLKILDFGIGKMVSSKDKPTASMSMQPGTCRYMAPEVFNLKVRSNLSEKVDIYSASLIIWQITTGVRPFDNVSTCDFYDPEKREKIRPYVESMTQWPELRDLVESAWDLEPENRPSAKEMLLMLSETPRCPPLSAPVSPLLYSVQMDAMAMSKTCFDCSIC
jgi:serine/threonine protein kinase